MQTGLLIGGIVTIFFGLIFVVVSVVMRRKAQAAQSWPVAPGQILFSTVETHTSTDSDGDTSTHYEPRVEYSYAVMGSPMKGNRISYGAMGSDYKSAQKTADQYPVGSAVSVHYNPEKPSESVLETTARGGTVFLIVGIVIAVIGIILLVVS